MQALDKIVNYHQHFEQLSEYWSPITIVETDAYKLHIVLALGEFIWHEHADTEKTFMVIEGKLKIDFRDQSILLQQGELFVIPKGVETKPSAAEITKLLIIDPVAKR